MNNDKNIELEIRAEIPFNYHGAFKKRLEEIGTLHSHTKRFSVMYFDLVYSKKIDIRVRITNGECEVVAKSGIFGSCDRTEVVQKIDHSDFIGMVRIFAQLNFFTKAGEREIFNYSLPGNIMISLVSASPIAYIEIEKMSSRRDVDKNKKVLDKYAKELKLKILKSERSYQELIARFDKEVDWTFSGTDNDYIKLEKQLSRHIKIK